MRLTAIQCMSLLLCGCLLPDVSSREQRASDAATPSAAAESTHSEATSNADASVPASAGAPRQPAGTCQPACGHHGICKQMDAAFMCECAGTGFRGHTCNEPDPCQPDNAGCDQECVVEQGKAHCVCEPGGVLKANGKDCVRWRSPQRLETVYPYELQPNSAFGPDGSVLAYWNAPTKATFSDQHDGARWVNFGDFQIAGVRYDLVAGWSEIETASAVASVSCVALSNINAHGDALAAHVEVDDDGRGTLIARRSSSAGWSDPLQVTSPMLGVGSPCAIAVDDQGRGLLVLSGGPGVRAARFISPDRWEAPTQVPGFAGDYRAWEITLRMQASGDATLIALGTHSRSGSLTASTFSTTTGWRSDPLELSTDGRELRVATNANGDAIVVWRVQQQLQSARFSREHGWGAIEHIAELGDLAERSGHDLSMNAHGQAWLVFVRTTHPALSSIWARPYSLATGWGTAVQISDELSQARIDVPGVAIDEVGNAATTWRRDDVGTLNQIWVNRYTVQAAAWLGPVALSMGRTDFSASAQVGIDAKFTPIAVWTSRQDQMSHASLWLSRWE